MNDPRGANRPDSTAVRPHTASPFRLGEWTVHPALNRITQDDRTIQVEPRVMHVLVCLTSRPGEVFTRETLLEIVWSDTVVCEEALTRTISELRRVFGDDPRQPRYIETIRKGGYRAIAPVLAVAEPPAPELTATSAQAVAPPREPTAPRRLLAGHRLITLAGVLIVIVTALTIITQGTRSSHPPLSVTLQGMPFTTFPGNEKQPAISPDGTQVAFAWDGGDGGNYSIYIKQRNTESPLRLTDDQGDDTQPTWSPDGSTIAFVRKDASGPAIYAVASIGGVPRRLLELEQPPCGLDWSPDGRTLAYGCAPQSDHAPGIALLSMETFESRWVTAPPGHFGGDGWPVFSPDGRTIAFRRSDSGLMDYLYVIPASGGTPTRLTPSQGSIIGIDWTANGEHLIFAASSGGNHSLMRLTLRDHALNRLATRGERALRPSISRSGDHLVYEELSYRADVYRVAVESSAEDSRPRLSDPQTFIASTRVDYGACFSPDGTMAAFLSNRTGQREIWVCANDGSNPRQLTRLGGAWVVKPCWSPDGRHIAFSADVNDCFCIHIVDVEGGRPRVIPTRTCHQIATLWSRDGEWIYYDAEDEKGWHIWRVRPDGTDASVIVKDGRWAFAQSSDGEALYHFIPAQEGIWRHGLSEATEELLVDTETAAQWQEIALVDAGIFFTQPNTGGSLLGYYSFDVQQCDSLAQLPAFCGGNLSVSPDGRTLVYDHVEQVERDLMLVEQFN